MSGIVTLTQDLQRDYTGKWINQVFLTRTSLPVVTLTQFNFTSPNVLIWTLVFGLLLAKRKNIAFKLFRRNHYVLSYGLFHFKRLSSQNLKNNV